MESALPLDGTANTFGPTQCHAPRIQARVPKEAQAREATAAAWRRAPAKVSELKSPGEARR
jgi:hypothetical protein